MAKVGFEQLGFCRVDYKEKKIRQENKEMEFIQYPYWNVEKNEAKIFTHITYDHYDLNFTIFKDFLENEDLELDEDKDGRIFRRDK